MHAHKSLSVLIIRSFLSFILRENQGQFSQRGSIYNNVIAKVEGNSEQTSNVRTTMLDVMGAAGFEALTIILSVVFVNT